MTAESSGRDTGGGWNPDAYLSFADDRGRPFHELLARVGAVTPRRVVDLGCGPGNLTATLARRWPAAAIEAWDSSPQMVAAARQRGIAAHLGDVRDWTPRPDIDVVVSNATLHWVPDHAALLTRWVRELPAGAWLAVGVPGNFDAPSHRAVRELVASRTWADALADTAFGALPVDGATGYAELLADAGCRVDAWETTYVHVLAGEHAVLRWLSGTTLRPVRERLDDDGWQRFRRDLIPLLDAAYPPRADGTTLFPFRRIVVVAQV